MLNQASTKWKGEMSVFEASSLSSRQVEALTSSTPNSFAEMTPDITGNSYQSGKDAFLAS